MNADWAGLPRNLVASILQRSVSVSEYLRLGAVCRAWHGVTMEDMDYLLPPPSPMLLVPSHAKQAWNLYSITDHKLLPLQFSMPCSAWFVGSLNGWLVTVDDNFVVRLLDPLYLFLGEPICHNPNACITLPPLGTTVFFQDGVRSNNRKIHKAVLSANPTISPDKYMVIAIIGYHDAELAFNRPSIDNEWCTFLRNYHSIEDVICFRDCIYAVDNTGDAFCCKVTDLEPRTKYKFRHAGGQFPSKKHLIESTAGELMMVECKGEWQPEGSGYSHRFDFKVWRMEDEGRKWMEMESLGDSAIFINHTISLSVVASDFPGCRPNCIYYTSTILRALCSLPFVVCNMETRSPMTVYMEDYASLTELEKRSPIWIVPSFKLN
ncbi:hypothetical protein V6N13_062037 [Hibiscus sabdariffa]|uniref:KIB1-4 beta-propeller domain-containing protein n=1 Tax=Hibiscus sabdariffa TaxID=183260 RepID=A0ABR2PF79_9ROSI